MHLWFSFFEGYAQKLFANEQAAQHQVCDVGGPLLDFCTLAQFSCAQAVRQQSIRRLQECVRCCVLIVKTKLAGSAPIRQNLCENLRLSFKLLHATSE